MTKKAKSPKLLKFSPYDRISVNQFSDFHLGKMRYDSDPFYVGYANKIFPMIWDAFSCHGKISKEDARRTTLMLMAYVEDLVSGTGVWEAFLSLYQKKYGKKMPFYPDDEATPVDEPSLHAVQFLLWYSINGLIEGTIFNPTNPGMKMLAEELLPILTEAFDEAPDTEPSRPQLYRPEEFNFPIFYQIRNICLWLCEGCYLTRVRDMDALTTEFIKFMEGVSQEVGGGESEVKYAVEAFVPFNALIGPLGIPAHEWLAEIADLYHEDGETEFLPLLRTIESKPYAFYRYDKIKEKHAVIVDPEGTEYNLSALTMTNEVFPKTWPSKSSALLSIVRFGDEWMMNGISLQPMPPSLYIEVRDKVQHEREEEAKRYRELMKMLDNRRIGVVAGIDECADMFGMNPADVDPDVKKAMERSDNLLYFVNTDSNISLMPDGGSYVKLPGNKFYNKEKAEMMGISVVFNHGMTTKEMREYIIDNNLIPDAALISFESVEVGKKLFQDNIRFFDDYSGRDTLPFLAPGQ